ncbi:flagellar basal body-associated protein FliL [Selenomonas sp.]|uniref:flagellar basal body-associated FliL family protein n=1 Tax=Selenomonas sp. TaxID=2053611 RepID=UPI0025E42B64|nr:flagellar basal body-associated FliL family protein [Selenomonas sp.]MCI6084771.1 flagellar basal body-associated FliL family protein [Selenomonas sp.]MCI6285140.1 flagellar basal body-associated FliL family protein [Selenomonas sp.]MDY3298229.1 flagellar basal body-associated FliL family protein [Selenomonas sp.]MDY4416732.1 flagellar basal body-associated FliL family protein [Selenomonas sp.]
MADEKKADAAPAAPPEEKKKKSPIILVVVLVIIGLLLAGGISFFITTKMMADTATEAGVSEHHDPGKFIKLGDAKEGILVNVGGVKAGKFLKAGIVLEMNPGKKDNVTEDGKLQPMAETKVLDTTMQILRSAKLDEFDATKQDDLKKKIKDELNDKLGPGSVYDVYFTSFLLQ